MRAIATLMVAVSATVAAMAAPANAQPVSAEAVIAPVGRACQWQVLAAGSALARSTDPRVREIARDLRDYDSRLRGQLERLAARTGTPLPRWPSQVQQQYMAILDRRTGLDFDVAFVNLLHDDDAQLLVALGQARAAWLDRDLGSFAEEALVQTLRYLTMLESTGLVDRTVAATLGVRLPPSSAPQSAPPPSTAAPTPVRPPVSGPAAVEPRLKRLGAPTDLVSGGVLARTVYAGSVAFLLALVGFGVILYLQRRVAAEAHRDLDRSHRAKRQPRAPPEEADRTRRRQRRSRGRHQAERARPAPDDGPAS
jgi:predicted outer membrane protein